MSLIIRPIETIAEYHAVEHLQRRAWAMADNLLEVVPLHVLKPVHTQGGLVLGAFDDDELLGFVFGFLGFTEEGRLKHCSHMMGVAPEHQSSGIGYQLKLAQREFALAQGHDLITWTYDPLQSRNAYLNMVKLGATCRTYIADYYGPMIDGLNASLPSDRFEVEWWIRDDRVERRLVDPGLAGRRLQPTSELDRSSAVQANRTVRTAKGFLAPGRLLLGSDAPLLQVEIPADYQAIKAADSALALEWRLATRQVFQAYFAAGYVAVDFVSEVTAGERQSSYLLQARSGTA
jgi:chorismate synthase